jgi:myb proto-oncogene protein
LCLLPPLLQWNSAAFKTFIASEYGRNAYADANLRQESSTPFRAEHDSAKAKPSTAKTFKAKTPPSKVKDLTTAAAVVAAAAAEEAYAAYSAAATARQTNSSAHRIITMKDLPAADKSVSPFATTTQMSASAVVPAKKSNREMKRPPPIMTTEEEQGPVSSSSCTATLTHSSVNHSRQSSPKGRAYTEEEDRTITRIVLSERDFTHWSGLAADINALFPPPPGTQQQPRTGKQVRDRWVNFLNPVINHEPWSREESIRLWKAYAECGKRWTVIGIEHFHTTRSENQIKNRWNSASFKYFVAEEYGKDAYKIANDAAITPSSLQHQVSAAVITPSSGSDTTTSSSTLSSSDEINDGMKRKFFEITAAELSIMNHGVDAKKVHEL